MATKTELRWMVFKDTVRINSSYKVSTKNTEAELRAEIFSQCSKTFPDLLDASVTREDNALDTKGNWIIEAESPEHNFLLIISKL